MKKPIYAALDLHSRQSVLGNMSHEGQTQPPMRFSTEANILRTQVERLRRKGRPLYLTMTWLPVIAVRPLASRLACSFCSRAE